MKLSKMALLAAICCGGSVSAADGRHAYYQPADNEQGQVAQVSHCDCGEAVCGCEVAADPDCGCETSCDGGCDSGCSTGCSDSFELLDTLGECDLGEQWSLFGEHCGYTVGGWVQMGYHNKNINTMFNNRDDEFNLHQAWVYAEKAIDTSGGFDVGGRIDYVYGIDAQDTQAFGITNDHWDNGWDNGEYGHALPQVYFEAGYGDLSVKAGHFFTIIGYEVVPAPDNFFYSHAYTMYNSEPFTHTGALATYTPSDDVTVYGGYVFGWDSGFEDNGDAVLGGVSLAMTDDLTVTYAAIGGRFIDDQNSFLAGERGYMQSVVADLAVTEKLQYVFQTDLLTTEFANGTTARDTFDINQYLLYSYSDCLAFGARFEWYENEGVFTPVGTDANLYALTLGTNYRPHANVVVRPEVRWDWDYGKAGVLENGETRQTTFGIDTIFLF